MFCPECSRTVHPAYRPGLCEDCLVNVWVKLGITGNVPKWRTCNSKKNLAMTSQKYTPQESSFRATDSAHNYTPLEMKELSP